MKQTPFLCIALLMLIAPRMAWSQSDCADMLPAGLSFPSVSSTLPYDATFSTTPGPGSTQKSFDLFSWSSFVALNWPSDSLGPNAKPLGGSIRDNPQASRVWESYIESAQVFKTDGGIPDAWGSSNSMLQEVIPGYRSGQKVLYASTKSSSNSAVELSQIGQASVGKQKLPPIADQNQKYVFYEIHLNQIEYNYVVENKLYNQPGQDAFFASAKPAPAISFPMGSLANPAATPPVIAAYGALEVKASWKVMGNGDDPTRFYTIKATMIDPATNKLVNDVSFGLVGLHIVTRTQSAKQWIWSTFEQVDNTPDVGATPLANHYSFNNPTKPQPAQGYDIEPPLNAPPVENPVPTQITRVINNSTLNSEWTNCLNTTMQTKLQGTVWAYYRLVTTQWPTAGSADGQPFVPQNVANTTMETYIQQAGSCMLCHSLAKAAGDQSGQSANFSYLLQNANKVAPPAEKQNANQKARARLAAAAAK